MRKQENIGKIVAYIAIVLVFVLGVGFLAYFTGGFTSDFKTFYVEIDGKEIMTNASGYEMTPDQPLTVNVKYTLSDEAQGYSVKVVPNALEGKDFDFTLDGDAYSYAAEKDLTNGFVVERKEDSFTITPVGGITDILQAVYPNNKVDDCGKYNYDNMFTLIVSSYNGKSSVSINFSIPEGISEIELDKTQIIF